MSTDTFVVVGFGCRPPDRRDAKERGSTTSAAWRRRPSSCPGSTSRRLRSAWGTATPRMTLAVYASAPVEADRSAAERLESRFFDGGETESTRAKIAPKRADFAVESPQARNSGGRNPR